MHAPAPRTWFGHPPGLTILFLTDMWEYFSYYGMRTLLVYYMTTQLMFGAAEASVIYGSYMGLLYLTPIFGGLLADRVLGRRRSVLIGAVIMSFGHFMMASESLFFPALGAIVIGNGFFFPSLPGQIGDLYPNDPSRRKQAYNVYYLGKNIGAFIAPLICGTLGETFGWHAGFAAAGVGMLLGLCIFVAGRRHLPPEPPLAARAERAPAAARDTALRYALLLAVSASVVVWRCGYGQLGSTIALWTKTGIDRDLLGWTIPMTWFQSLNPLIVFALLPVLMAMWATRARQGRETTDVVRMATGALISTGAYALLTLIAFAAGGDKVSWLWLAAFFVIITIGELYVLPVGVSLFTQLAPPSLVVTTVAFWFLNNFAGNFLAGALGVLWPRMSPASYFLLMTGLTSVATLLLFALDRPVKAALLRSRALCRQ